MNFNQNLHLAWRSLAIAGGIALSGLACAELREYSAAGTLQIDSSAQRPATLHVACSPDKDGGALSIELNVPEANTRKDFGYDDFEGPDAAAGDKALSRIVWTSAGKTTEITLAAAGWYAPEPPDSFVFGVSQLSRQRGAAAKLLATVSGAGGSLEWQQRGFGKDARNLVARFELEPAAAQKLRSAALPCLPVPAAK